MPQGTRTHSLQKKRRKKTNDHSFTNTLELLTKCTYIENLKLTVYRQPRNKKGACQRNKILLYARLANSHTATAAYPSCMEIYFFIFWLPNSMRSNPRSKKNAADNKAFGGYVLFDCIFCITATEKVFCRTRLSLSFSASEINVSNFNIIANIPLGLAFFVGFSSNEIGL